MYSIIIHIGFRQRQNMVLTTNLWMKSSSKSQGQAREVAAGPEDGEILRLG